MDRSSQALTSLVALLTVLLAVSVVAAEVPDALPDPGDEAPDATRPVKVYILMGQSNMIGFGQIGPADQKGTLEYYAKTENRYPHLVDDAGNWTVRKDVWCVQSVAGKRRDWLQPGFGAKAQFIGPELGFGHVMGYVHDEYVLIIKASMGNRALGWDLLPPSSRTEPPEEHENQWYQGYQLDVFVKNVHGVLNNLKKNFPAYQGQGYEIAGFVWWQGHKDQSTPGHVVKDPRYNISYPDDYEKNLVNLINDLRKEFKAPKAPFVLATIAFEGEKLAGGGLKVANAQLAVSNPKQYPEFKGNVKTVEARPYWRDASESPSRAGYHYNHNAGTYMDVGDALGRAMAELLEGK